MAPKRKHHTAFAGTSEGAEPSNEPPVLPMAKEGSQLPFPGATFRFGHPEDVQMVSM